MCLWLFEHAVGAMKLLVPLRSPEELLMVLVRREALLELESKRIIGHG